MPSHRGTRLDVIVREDVEEVATRPLDIGRINAPLFHLYTTMGWWGVSVP